MSYCRSYFCCFSCFTTALDPKSCCFCFYFFFLKFYRTQTLEQPVLKSTIAGMDIIHQPKCLMLLKKPHNLSLLLGLGFKSSVSLDEGRGHRRCCERSAARSSVSFSHYWIYSFHSYAACHSALLQSKHMTQHNRKTPSPRSTISPLEWKYS